MPAGYGFESYGQVTKSEPASSVGARLMVQGQNGGMAPGAMEGPGEMEGDMDADDTVFGPMPSQTTGNPVNRPELMPGTDSSLAAAVGQLLSRTGGGAGKNRPVMPPNSTQDETLLNAGFSPEELALFKQMGGVK